MVVQAKQDIYGRGHHVSYRPGPTIVAIGASAGGLKALQTFFDRLPERVGAAIVVVIHLDPEHESELSQILAAHTRMPVIQVREAVTLETDHIYVIPPDRRLQVNEHQIAAVDSKSRGMRAPVDLFFRSLAVQHGDGFATILRGAGFDGTIGVKLVKQARGEMLF
jgi:two-component system, chemotaxis family, CheB/CheR fusion protein